MAGPLTCPICYSTYFASEPARQQDIECARCGTFSIDEAAVAVWAELAPEDPSRLWDPRAAERLVTNASGWIHDHPGVHIDAERARWLAEAPAPGLAQRAERLLRYLGSKLPVDHWISADNPFGSDLLGAGNNNAPRPELLALTWSTPEELHYLLRDYLWKHKGWLAEHPQSYHTLTVSPAGWDYLDSLDKLNPDSRIGFCAMWFADEMRAAWEQAIEGAIADAGYEPLVMFKYEHNNRIDDEIVALIRRSRFVVADFTGQRGGVYFEAGFAAGLGLPVVWTCRSDDMQNIHFDNRQFNFIEWDRERLPEFRAALRNRIEATIGRGRAGKEG